MAVFRRTRLPFIRIAAVIRADDPGAAVHKGTRIAVRDGEVRA